MYPLIYVSTAVEQMTSDQLRELLSVSRRNNIGDGVTGMLFYHEGSFFQVLERSANADDFDGSEDAYDLMETFRACLR